MEDFDFCDFKTIKIHQNFNGYFIQHLDGTVNEKLYELSWLASQIQDDLEEKKSKNLFEKIVFDFSNLSLIYKKKKCTIRT